MNFQTRKDINSLFGLYSVKKKTGDITFTDEKNTGNQIKDFVLRETGILSEYKQVARAVNALSDPEDYLTKKNTDLLAIAEKLNNVFGKALKEYLNRGFSQKEATERALEETKRVKTNEMILHLENFPTKIRDMSMKDIK